MTLHSPLLHRSASALFIFQIFSCRSILQNPSTSTPPKSEYCSSSSRPLVKRRLLRTAATANSRSFELVMDVNNSSMHGQQPCRRLDFENDDDLASNNEAEMHDTNCENKMNNQTDTHMTASIDEIHARISAELIPKIGMEFDTVDAGYEFYLAYAKAAGFGVRVGRSHKDKEMNHIWDIVFCCAKEGKRKKDVRDASVRKHRSLTRCNCLAEMKISSRQANKYRIVKFIATYNHDCVTPSKSHFIRSHRRMTAAQKAEVDVALSCGIAQRETMELLAKQVGGREHLDFIVDDCKNYLRTKRTNELRSGDITGVLKYLQRKQADDPNFFYAIQVDGDELITNIFWVDSKMRSDYLYFGDVVSFDTTYRKHKDSRPIALFVGINNHKQTTIFGAALLYDETAVTFSWLFDTFAATMLGKKPQTILTDQDKAMSKELASQWPETYHRLCVWHINQNAAIHLSNVFAQHKDFAKDFSSCMFDHENEDDFVDAWNKMLHDYDLQNNEWLAGMFKIKEKWALVYGRETFCGGMCTTQRSESMNSAIKKYISYKNNLDEFFEHFETFLKDRRHKELRADFSSNQSTPSLELPVLILQHGAEVYTQSILELFKAEVYKSFDCTLEIFGEIATISTFKVKSYSKLYNHHIAYDSIDSSVSCSCKKFEFVGILCSHALKVLNFKQIVKIPDQYIKKRWMKTAKKQNFGVDLVDQSHVDPKELMSYQYKDLCKYYSQVISRAAESQKGYQIAKQGLKELLEKVNASCEGVVEEPVSANITEKANLPNVVDSIQSNIGCTKVRGIKAKERITFKTSKRPRSGLEKPTKRRKSNTGAPKSKDQNLVVDNGELSIVNEVTDQELHLQGNNCQNMPVVAPYSFANVHLNQNSYFEFQKQPEIGVSLPSTNNSYLVDSTKKQGSTEKLTDLLKMMDPNVKEQQASMCYDPKYLLFGRKNFQFKEQED